MMNYLNDKTREIVINSSDKERIHFTQNFSWIGYTQSINVFKKLDDLTAACVTSFNVSSSISSSSSLLFKIKFSLRIVH